MGNYGIKVSQEGYDVTTTDDNELILKPAFKLLKVFSSGSVSIDGGAWATISHNLGYIPQFLAYLNDGTGKVYLCTANFDYGLARADATNLYIGNSAYVGTCTAYYYIFYEQA